MTETVASKRVETLLHSMFVGTGRNIVLGLRNMYRLLGKLGNPEQRLPPVIHVAGTNGKGSTLAFLTAMLQAGGYRVHRYTSPHLQRFNERIVLDGREITDNELLPYLEAIQKPAKQCGTTFFETTTAIALQAFADHPADIILLETGLGGRLDATNVMEKPLLTVITPIALDHEEYLGSTLAKIAFEKAGIFKKRVPAVIAQQHWEAQMVLESQAEKFSAPLHCEGELWKIQEGQSGWQYHGNGMVIDVPPLSLAGMHQYANAGTALACMEAIAARFPVGRQSLQEGLQQATWPGRLQRLQKGTVVDMASGMEIWLDGGHNAAGAAAIADWLGEQVEDGPVDILCGLSHGRDAGNFLPALARYTRQCYALTIPGEDIAPVDARQIRNDAGLHGVDVITVETVEALVDDLVTSSSTPAKLLICGSLYLAGHVLAMNEGERHATPA